MKKCIWCFGTEKETPFVKVAHTIPQSLGGLNTCANVCDLCNSFFGMHYNKLPPIETVIKETFNISRARLLAPGGHIGKNKTLARFSSIYFNVNFAAKKIDLKPAYKFIPHFQQKIARQLRKGIYKIYLEETERQTNNGHNNKFDFIREFCLHDIGDYPVYYFERNFGIIMMSESWIKNPELFFEKDKQFEYLLENDHFFEFELLGHVFSIAKTTDWQYYQEEYLQETMKVKEKFFYRIRQVNRFDDIDLTLSVLDNYRRP